MASRSRNRAAKGNNELSKRSRLLQSDVPFYSVTQALRVPQVLADQYAGRPAKPLHVAQGLNVQPTSGPFRMLCGSAVAYGLTDGGYNVDQISLTPLGRRAVMPTSEGDDARALREAILKPRVLKEFLQKYDQAKLPRDDIARNVLSDMGVPRELADKTLKLIVESARTVGFVRDVNGVSYIDLQGTPLGINDSGTSESSNGEEEESSSDSAESQAFENIPATIPIAAPSALSVNASQLPSATRVFISHGKNMDIVDQIKTMLNVAEIDYEIAVESESTAIPVPEKVFDAMRSCTAAVICVTADHPSEGQPATINQNVLIEIGAAFVLYDKRVILLWDKRLGVPSNLQGLYRCEFSGSELSWSAGMKLREGIKKFRTQPSPKKAGEVLETSPGERSRDTRHLELS